MRRLGHTLVVGDVAKIRAAVVRKTKSDRRDARHILALVSERRFPTIWVPDPEVRDRRALIAHRMRLVRVRTLVRNSVHAAAWTAQQIVDCFPDDTAPAYLLRDRDAIYGDSFRQRVKGMYIHQVLTAARSPGRIPSRNPSSARSGESVSTISSS